MSAHPDTLSAAAERDAAALRRALREVVRAQQLRDRGRAAEAGITASGAHALEVLAERGPLSLTALTAELFVDRSTACRIVGVLEDRGLVARRADERDGRSIRVELTAAGASVEARLRQDAVREAAALLMALEVDERRVLLRALGRLQRSLRAPALSRRTPRRNVAEGF